LVNDVTPVKTIVYSWNAARKTKPGIRYFSGSERFAK
jgi:hypothetical protein